MKKLIADNPELADELEAKIKAKLFSKDGEEIRLVSSNDDDEATESQEYTDAEND